MKLNTLKINNLCNNRLYYRSSAVFTHAEEKNIVVRDKLRTFAFATKDHVTTNKLQILHFPA